MKSFSGSTSRRGFTITEMVVAVGLLLVIMSAVGQVFRSTGQAISLSQAHNEMVSNVRAVQEQMERDVSGLNRQGFIVIRSQLYNGRRIDMITFLANGQFPDRTGAKNTSGPFTNSNFANAAVISYGQAAIEAPTRTMNNSITPANQTNPVTLVQLPTGTNDQDFILYRHATLLMAGTSTSANQVANNAIYSAAYADIKLGAATVQAMSGEANADISSCRLDDSTLTPNGLMASIQSAITTGGRSNLPRYEADNYCYRFKMLMNPYSSEQASDTLINGYFRMHAIALQGTATFAVDWTDWKPGTAGQITWYGLTDTTAGVNPKYAIGTDNTEPAAGTSGDGYTAIFSYDNLSKWPTALRFRYRVTDPNDRLNGGREFAQVLHLPN